MPGIYKLFTAIVALIGNISLIATGEVRPVFSLMGAGLLWGYYRSLKGYGTIPKWALGSLSLSTFIVFLLNFYASGDIFLSVAEMTLMFQALKSFDIKEPWDPMQVFFMSLLQLLMASELTNALYFGIVFLVFLVFIVVSISLGHFVREGQKVFGPYVKPVVLITMLTIVITGVFFVVTPRLRSGLWGKSFLKGIKTAGFSEKVDFGSFGEVKRDETVVMWVIVRPDMEEPVYLRGMTFDYFDGTAWYDKIKDFRRIYKVSDEFDMKVPAGVKKFESEIYLEPMDSDVIFTFKKPYRIESEGFYMRRDNADSFYMKGKISKRFFYRVFSFEDSFYDNAYIHSYLQLPAGISNVKKLAGDITFKASGDFGKAKSIKDYLAENYSYSLFTEKPEGGANAIEHFLFNSKSGYCEHFATAMALMLRSAGIPARLVTGFLTSRKNDFGDYYLVRQSDSHSWVEAFISDRWVTFDPTPPVLASGNVSLFLVLDMINMNWNRYVVGFSSYDQRYMTVHISNYTKGVLKLPGLPYMKIVLLTGVLIIFYAVYKIRHKGISFAAPRVVSSEYVRFRKKVSRYGGRVSPASTSDDVLKEAMKTGRFNQNAIKKFIDTYRFLRFSGKAERDKVKDFQKLSKTLRGKRI